MTDLNLVERTILRREAIPPRKSRRDYQRRYYAENKLVCQTYARQWYHNNIEKVRKSYAKRRTELIAKANVVRIATRQRVIAKYGGKCVCCSESRFEFMTVDHVFNDGCKERRYLPSTSLYRKLDKSEVINDRYQLLCMNCNWAKAKYGKCPHQI